MLKKIWSDQKKRNNLMFCIMTVVFTAALYAGSTGRGFISAFPIFFICAVSVFLFYRQLKVSLLITALLSLTVSLVDFSGYNSVSPSDPALSYTLIKVLFFVLSAALAYAMAGWLIARTRAGVVKAVLCAVLYLLFFNAFFGNIFGALKWHNAASGYLKENYPLQKIESMSTAFNFKSRCYETAITFKEPRRSYYGEEKIVLQDNYDGYFLYAQKAMFEIGSSLLTGAVRDAGIDIQFTVNSLPLEEKLNRTLFDLGGDYGRVLPKLSYQVVIKDDTPDIQSFEQKCRMLTQALEGKFPYTHLILYGGEKGGFLFEAEMRDGALTVKNFDKNSYINNRTGD